MGLIEHAVAFNSPLKKIMLRTTGSNSGFGKMIDVTDCPGVVIQSVKMVC